MPRKATIGPEIYTRVNALVAEGQKRTDAFAQVAQERGSRPGSVAANYYRVARSTGPSTPKPRRNARRIARKATTTTATRQRRTSTASRPTATSTSTAGDINQIAQQIAELTEQLVRQVNARDQRIRQLLG